jgi:hypothetical protein
MSPHPFLVLEPANELPSVPSEDLIKEALAHLGAAKVQFIASDDPQIREHVLAAHGLLTLVSRRLP